MIKLKAKIYKKNENGVLYPIGQGECGAYIPVNDDGSGAYLSLNFGEYSIHFDKQDFLNLCKQALNSKLLK